MRDLLHARAVERDEAAARHAATATELDHYRLGLILHGDTGDLPAIDRAIHFHRQLSITAANQAIEAWEKLAGLDARVAS